MLERIGSGLLRALLRLLPPAVRREYGADIEEVARRRRQEAEARGRPGPLRFWTREVVSVAGAVLTAWADRLPGFGRDPAHRRSLLAPLGQALSLAFRTLRRSPTFTGVAILVIMAGVGANTAIFSLANWALLRPVPGVEDPSTLVGLELVDENGDLAAVSHPMVERLAGAEGAVSSFAAYSLLSVDLRTDPEADAVRVVGQLVTPGFFRTVGTAVRGRAFRPEEGDRNAVHAVAVVAPDLLGPDTDPLGARVLIGGRSFEVVGVVPPGFRGVSRSDRARVWLPASAAPVALGRVPPSVLSLEIVPIWVRAVGRRVPGVSLESAADRIARAVPELEERGLSPRLYERVALPPSLRQGISETLALLTGLVFLLLLLTVGNLGNLFLTRVAGRRREASVRRALGASEGQLTVDLLAESQVLGLVGALAATGSAFVLLRLVDASQVIPWLPEPEAIPLDGRVLAFSLGVTLGSALLAALVGAIALRRVGPGRSGLPQARDPSHGGERRIRRALVAIQVAFSLVLVIGAALVLRSFGELRARHLGFEAEQTLAFSLNPGLQGYDAERADQLFRTLLDELRDRPDVDRAAFTWLSPLGVRRYSENVATPGAAGEDGEVTVAANMVSPGYFATLGIEVTEGRDFGAEEYLDPVRRDRGEVVVNEALARRLYPGGSALGREIRMPGRTESAFEIVGVVADARLVAVDEPAGPQLFDPFGNGYRTTSATFVVRGPAAAEGGADLLGWVEERAGGLPVLDPAPLGERVEAALGEERALGRILGAFAILSLTLAVAGLFGLVSGAVQARAREYGIRQALGAGRVETARLVVLEGMTPVALGVLGGITLAWVLAPGLEPRLLGMEAAHGPTFLGSAAVLLLVALAATLPPLLRALTTDPRTVMAED